MFFKEIREILNSLQMLIFVLLCINKQTITMLYIALILASS